MFKLRTGYIVSAIATGLLLLFSFLFSLPDGKLHMYVCDVGQGDGIYIRFPDGRDMVVDGGPSDAITKCLGNHMPFWDRHIDIVAMTHPQKDHIQGLISVLTRYSVDYFMRTDVDTSTDVYESIQKTLSERHVSTRYIVRGERIQIGQTNLSVLWPSSAQIAKGKPSLSSSYATDQTVLGAVAGDVNEYCLVFWLRYGSFDALLTGDADMEIEDQYIGTNLADGIVEVLKVPHHGSRTGMTKAFVDWLHPKLALISVGKNTYGHPSQEAIHLLESVGSQIHRTDKEGDIEVISDGASWTLHKSR